MPSLSIIGENGITVTDVTYRRTMGLNAAFLTCDDKGRNKYYWGFCKKEDDSVALKTILSKGAKWRGKDDDGNILL